ncbi:MAG: hypothetical protein VX910_11730 [Candidatus Latescibacterota bacterium]|nr:hypothetical protein [Candidatus Latescibacterota bacterium]
MRFFKTPLLIAIAMLLWSPCPGEELTLSVSDHRMVLTTHQGLVVEGQVVEITAGKVTFDAGDRILEFAISEIASIQPILPIASSGPHWLPNPNKTRLLFSPTGRMIKAGEGYLADHMVFFPAFAVGLTDYLTLGGGVSLFPGISIDEQMFFVTPKLGFYSSEDVNLAIGALVAGFPGTDEDEGVGGILYGVGTVGSEDASVTVGLGFGFFNDEIAGKPVVMIGGEKRLSKGLSLVTENWLVLGEGEQFISYGCRLFGERFSVDLAFLNTIGEDALFPGIPYIDVVYAFMH